MKLPWMKFFIDDWASGVRGMTCAEKGAYIELLVHAWSYGGIPADPKRCALIAGMTRPEFDEAWREALSSKFSPHPDDTALLVNTRQEAIRQDQEAKVEKGRERVRRHRAKKADVTVTPSVTGGVTSGEHPRGTQDPGPRKNPSGSKKDTRPTWRRVLEDEFPDLALDMRFTNLWSDWLTHLRELGGSARMSTSSARARFGDFQEWGWKRTEAAIRWSMRHPWKSIHEQRSGPAPSDGGNRDVDRRHANMRAFLEASGDTPLLGEGAA